MCGIGDGESSALDLLSTPWLYEEGEKVDRGNEVNVD